MKRKVYMYINGKYYFTDEFFCDDTHSLSVMMHELEKTKTLLDFLRLVSYIEENYKVVGALPIGHRIHTTDNPDDIGTSDIVYRVGDGVMVDKERSKEVQY